MRNLDWTELKQVSGGVGDPVPHDNRDGAKWGNNGFGNGADRNNTPPGQSGIQEPVNNGNGWGKRDSRGTSDLGPR